MTQFILMILIIVVICAGVSIFLLHKDFQFVIICSVVCIVANIVIAVSDYTMLITDEEIYSGKIISVEHNEEYDQWHPPRTETYTTTDSKGNTVTETRIIEGYWEHHYATNYIKTTDNGTIQVYKIPSGKKLTDSFVNSTKELEEYYPIGSPTASIHKYKNKVQASSSIYKNTEVDVENYPNLPEYPSVITSDYTITRLIGDVPNKNQAIRRLNEINTQLNDTDNPNNTSKVKAYKQCNLIFVNMGDVTQDNAFALQNQWKNGNKNDFIISFGMKDNKITWCYPFSWTEIESLKSDIKYYMMDLEEITDFVSVIEDISAMVESKFERKEFADFEYLQIELSTFAKVAMIILTIIGCGVMIVVDTK